jgi:hypothetical protein
MADIHDQPSNDPGDIFEQQVADGSDRCVACFNMIAFDRRRIPQHGSLLYADRPT